MDKSALIPPICYFWGNESAKTCLWLVASRHYRPTNLTKGIQPQHHVCVLQLTHKDNLPILLSTKSEFYHGEEDLSKLVKELKVDNCVFSYSDVPYQHVISVRAFVNAAGANFVLLGPEDTQIKSSKPVISLGAVRTGCGKSQTSRRIIEILMARGLKVVAIRHPMPYDNIAPQKLQRF